MRYSFILLILFIIFSLGISGAALFRSEFLEEETAGAGGFGASPPVIRAGALKTGESFGATITALRSEIGYTQSYATRVSADGFEDWVIINPSPIAEFGINAYQSPITLAINIPDDALPGDYLAYVNLNNTPTASANSGVGIALGARINIEFSVLGEPVADNNQSSSSAIMLNDLAKHNDYKGRLIRYNASPEVYYVSYNEPLLIPILNNDSTYRDLQNSAVLIEEFSLNYIPIGIAEGSQEDNDSDGVPDYLEAAIGTNIYSEDTDNDNYNDYYELANGFSPFVSGTVSVANSEYAEQFAGQIYWEKDKRTNLWYVSVEDDKRYLFCQACDNEELGLLIAEEISDDDWAELIK